MHLTNYAAPSPPWIRKPTQREVLLTTGAGARTGSQALRTALSSEVSRTASRWPDLAQFIGLHAPNLFHGTVPCNHFFRGKRLMFNCCNLNSKCSILCMSKSKVLTLLVWKIPYYKNQVLPFESSVAEAQILAYLLILFWPVFFPSFSFDCIWPLFSSDKNHWVLQNWHSKARILRDARLSVAMRNLLHATNDNIRLLGASWIDEE